jgi:Protein of unknown function (DUF3240)
MNAPPVVLTLIAPRALQDKLVEMLLAHELANAAGFTVREVVAYGRDVEFRTTAEQISGRVKRIEIRAVLSPEVAREIASNLEATVTGQRIEWSISATMASGTIA